MSVVQGEAPIVRFARDEAHRLKPLGGQQSFGSLRELARFSARKPVEIVYAALSIKRPASETLHTNGSTFDSPALVEAPDLAVLLPQGLVIFGFREAVSEPRECLFSFDLRLLKRGSTALTAGGHVHQWRAVPRRYRARRSRLAVVAREWHF